MTEEYYWGHKELPEKYAYQDREYTLRQVNYERGYALYRLHMKGRPKEDFTYELWRIRYNAGSGYFMPPIAEGDYGVNMWVGDIEYLRMVVRNNFPQKKFGKY